MMFILLVVLYIVCGIACAFLFRETRADDAVVTVIIWPFIAFTAIVVSSVLALREFFKFCGLK